MQKSPVRGEKLRKLVTDQSIGGWTKLSKDNFSIRLPKQPKSILQSCMSNFTKYYVLTTADLKCHLENLMLALTDVRFQLANRKRQPGAKPTTTAAGGSDDDGYFEINRSTSHRQF